MREPGASLVVSCYELGRPPLGAASLVAFLERDGFRPAVLDLAVERLEPWLGSGAAAGCRLVAISTPMHTALRVGVDAARRIRAVAPRAHLCFFGLYATLNAGYLFEAGLADSIAGGESESTLVELARSLEAGRPAAGVRGLGVPGRPAEPVLARLDVPVPSRASLPPVERYAHLEIGDERRPAAAIEASRGCLHVCRHCPITPVYRGRFFVVPAEIVLEDVARLVASGVRHLTFADPDFLNGPRHALGLVRAIRERHPGITFDITTRIEHVLERRTAWREMAESGCAFVVSAVESLSDTVLGHLDKGHTRRDVFEALELLEGAGIPLRPTFIPFTPWSTLEDYLELVDWIERAGLLDRVDPVQLTLRLLVPPGSELARLEAMRPHLAALAPERFQWIWRHPDPRVDRLCDTASRIVRQGAFEKEPASATMRRLREAAERAAGGPRFGDPFRLPVPVQRARAARLSEPWFC